MTIKYFLVWCPSYDETVGEALKVSADTAQAAAEFWAEDHDRRSCGQYIIKGIPARVIAESIATGEQTEFYVSGFLKPTYSATPGRL